jgi:hypothetical protein
VKRPGARLTLVLALVLALVLSLVAASHGPHHRTSAARPAAARATAHHGRGHQTVSPATFSGPDGIEATWVVKENERKGTPDWQITNPNGAGGIEGYASEVQATAGQDVTLYVSTSAPTYVVQAYRIGYYGGDGARLVWQSPTEQGVVQPTCPVTSGTNMVECSWSPSVGVKISKAFVQGDYLFKLTGSGNQQSYVPLTVWDPASQATYLVQNSVLTWQAWNPYGGYDLYTGATPCAPNVYPCSSRARVVSFDRPYDPSYGEGAADFLGEEYPLIQFMEQHGLDVTYATDITTDEDPQLLLNHRAVLSLGHDEQWSLSMRNAATTALAHGVNLVFFGASPVLRKVRLQPSPLGPDREVVNYRDPEADPDYSTDPSEVSQNEWIQPPANWSPSELVASTYLGAGFDVPLVVSDASSWLYQGTGLENGAQLSGVIQADYNSYVSSDPNPPNVEILAHSPVKPAVGTAGYADTVYYTSAQSKGGVFSSGTNAWIPSMSPCAPSSSSCPATAMDQMTGNLLRLFGSGPAGVTQPSVANWQSFYP